MDEVVLALSVGLVGHTQQGYMVGCLGCAVAGTAVVAGIAVADIAAVDIVAAEHIV